MSINANVVVQQQFSANSSGNIKSNDQILNSNSEATNVHTRPYYQGPGSTQAVSEGNQISPCVQATPTVVTDPAWYPDTGATWHLTHDSTHLQHSNPATGSLNYFSTRSASVSKFSKFCICTIT
ncbi:uncharacterized protein LOC128041838 isoform X5 [Gossypium raimondii]|uniref:uncharacterized protein LOC128041838 isoform X5 n=1 Tax=Gossypium raimondii TaxID=29730 RepID=UPI00227A92F2|nr:uncharacterized protein LOC128041838 isoform X5 [Gossypium raimondii]